MENYVSEVVLRAIRVSNSDETQLHYLLDHGRIKPATNQIQSHPGHWNHGIIEFCQANGVTPVAWGPLSRVQDSDRAMLTEIGAKYGKTWAQVALRYQIERGVAVIPKSHNSERQKQNLALFDFELTKEEKTRITEL